MDGSKIKSFVIYLLVAVNLIFLSLVIADSSRSAKLQRQQTADLTAVLKENGVTLDASALPATRSQPLYTLSRDLEAESALSAALLGPAEGQDRGGNIYAYTSARGASLFRGNGEFEITLSTPLSLKGRSEEDAARRLLKDMGLSAAPGPLRDEEETLTAFSFLCAVDDLPVYNCGVSLSFSPDGLVSVAGRRPIGPASKSGAQVEMNPATALLTLISHVKSSGQVFSRILSMEAGYTMNVSVSGSAELAPVWRIDTDAGEFYVNSQILSVVSINT